MSKKEKPFKLSLLHKILVFLFYSKKEKEELNKKMRLINACRQTDQNNNKTELIELYNQVKQRPVSSNNKICICGDSCKRDCSYNCSIECIGACSNNCSSISSASKAINKSGDNSSSLLGING
jgi:hypothetical protein